MKLSRITLLAGHFGSGKTQIALNLALWLRRAHERVTLCDLDIVNPYFRSGVHSRLLDRHGVRLITSDFSGSNVELLGVPPEAAAVFDDKKTHAVLDIGGDDRGALALGRYADRISQNAEAVLVVNRYRYLSGGVAEALAIMRDIESAGRIRFSRIINNSNLGAQTTVTDVLASVAFVTELSRRTGLPVAFTCAVASISAELSRRITPVFPLKIYPREDWTI